MYGAIRSRIAGRSMLRDSRDLPDDILKQVIKFLSELQAEPVERINPSSRLREDIGLDGDDVDELLSYLVKEFCIDISSFDFYRYFKEEPHFGNLTQWLIPQHKANKRLKTITVADVVRSIQAKSWIDPVG